MEQSSLRNKCLPDIPKNVSPDLRPLSPFICSSGRLTAAAPSNLPIVSGASLEFIPRTRRTLGHRSCRRHITHEFAAEDLLKTVHQQRHMARCTRGARAGNVGPSTEAYGSLHNRGKGRECLSLDEWEKNTYLYRTTKPRLSPETPFPRA